MSRNSRMCSEAGDTTGLRDLYYIIMTNYAKEEY